MQTYKSQKAQQAREKLFRSIQRAREEVLDWRQEAERPQQRFGGVASPDRGRQLRPQRPPRLPGAKRTESLRQIRTRKTLQAAEQRARIHEPGKGRYPSQILHEYDARDEDLSNVCQIHAGPTAPASEIDPLQTNNNDSECDDLFSLYPENGSSGFIPCQAHALRHVDTQEMVWNPCTLHDFQGDRYLICWPEETNQFWISWTRVWRSDKENLATHQARMSKLQAAIVDSVQNFITDVGVNPVPQTQDEELNDPNAPFLEEVIGPITSPMVNRLVLKSKPMLRPFQLNGIYGSTHNSPALWRSMLEEVHGAFMQAQFLASVRWRLKSKSDFLSLDTGAAMANPSRSRVQRLARMYSKRAFIGEPRALAALQKINMVNEAFSHGTLLIDESFIEQMADLKTFSTRQQSWIKRIGAKTRSSWIVAVYDALLEHVVRNPNYQQQQQPSEFHQGGVSDSEEDIIQERQAKKQSQATSTSHDRLCRLLKLTQLMIWEALSRLVASSLVALERGFTQRRVQAFCLETKVERLTMAEWMQEERVGLKRRTLARQRLTMLNEDWLMIDELANSADRDDHFMLSALESSNSEKPRSRQLADTTLSDEADDDDDLAAEHLGQSDHFKIELIPTCNMCIKVVQDCVVQIVQSVQNFPRIDALVLDSPKIPETESVPFDVLLEESMSPKEVAQRLAQVLANDANASERECQRMSDVLHTRAQGLDMLDKAQVLLSYGEDLNAFRAFGAFHLSMQGVREKLIHEAEELRKEFLQNKLKDTLVHCEQITAVFEEARARLTIVTRTSEDLERVMLELAQVPERMQALEAMIEDNIMPAYDLFEQEQYIMNEDDLAAMWRVLGLPGKLQMRAGRVRHDIELRKRDICTELEDLISRHHKRLLDFQRMVEVVGAYVDLNRIDEYAVNASLLEENILEAHEKTKELISRSSSIGLGDRFIDTEKLSQSLVDRILPICALWSAAADISEIHVAWHKGSLLKLDVNGLIERIRIIQEEVLPKDDSLTTHPVSIWVRRRVGEVHDTEKLVRAITARGLQHYHWVKFSAEHSLALFEPTYDSTLEKVVRENPHLLRYLDALVAMADIAATEFRYEQTLDDMEFQLKRHLDDPETAVWKLEVLIENHLFKLREMRKEEHVENLFARMRVWEEKISSKLQIVQSHALECKRAKLEVINAWRRHEPRLCYLSDRELLSFWGVPKISDSSEDILGSSQASPPIGHSMKIIQALYPWYAVPALMQNKTTHANDNRRNLLGVAVTEVAANTSVDTEDGLSSGRASQMFSTVFNDINESFALAQPCSAVSLDLVDMEIGKMVKELSLTSLQKLKMCMEDESPNLSSWLMAFPKQALIVALRIFLCENSLKQTKLVSEVCALLVTARNNTKSNQVLTNVETMLSIAHNHEQTYNEDPDAIFQFAYDESCDDIAISFENQKIYYGSEIVRGQATPLLYMPSMRWHFTLTKVFHRASESIVFADEHCERVSSVAAELGRHCHLLSCSSLEELLRVQQGIRRTKWWVIIQDRASWGALLHFSPDPRNILVATRKKKLPPSLDSKLRPCKININMEALHAQGVIPRPSYNMRASGVYRTSSHADGSESEKLELFTSMCSDCREWERKIKRFLRRMSEDSWAGAPSRIVIHDMERPNGEVRNFECLDLILRLQEPGVLTDVVWSLVNRSHSFMPQVVNTSEIPTSVQCVTLILMDGGDPETRALLAPFVEIPSEMAIQSACDVGKSQPLRIVCFDNSKELFQLEDRFPRIRRIAVRLQLDPWWLSKTSLMERVGAEDSTLAELLAESFITTLLAPGVGPAEFVRLEERVREVLPQRMQSLTEECKQLTEELMSLSALSDDVEDIAGTNDDATSLERIARIGELREHLAQQMDRLKHLPQQIVAEVSTELLQERSSSKTTSTS